MADITLLKKQRQMAKGALTRIYNYCNLDYVEVEDVRARCERAEDLFNKYEEVQNKIDAQVQNESEQAIEEKYLADTEHVFFSIKAAYNKLCNRCNAATATAEEQHNTSELASAMQALIQHQSSMNVLMERFASNVHTENPSTPNEHVRQQQTEPQLLRIQLPEFDGNLLDWVRFKELFEALIHNRSSLANVEKLEYLQSKLKGEASVVIKHLKPTNNNYQVAWELLNKIYNNIEKVKAAYMELLFEQPAMKSASVAETKSQFHQPH